MAKSGLVNPRIRQLSNPTAGVRCQAALALGDLGDAVAIPALVGCLRDTGPSVRAAAIEALAKLGATSAASRIIGALTPCQRSGGPR